MLFKVVQNTGRHSIYEIRVNPGEGSPEAVDIRRYGELIASEFANGWHDAQGGGRWEETDPDDIKIYKEMPVTK